MSDQNTKKGFAVFILFIFAFFLWMCAQIPYTGDDWSWGTEIGLR